MQRSSIRGTDTDLQFQGTIPTAGNAPMSLLLLGSVDLHIAQLFNPDLRTSGQLKFNVNSYGAANVQTLLEPSRWSTLHSPRPTCLSAFNTATAPCSSRKTASTSPSSKATSVAAR